MGYMRAKFKNKFLSVPDNYNDRIYKNNIILAILFIRQADKCTWKTVYSNISKFNQIFRPQMKMTGYKSITLS